MPAPAGNKYASKWTREKTDHYLKIIEGLAVHRQTDYLGQALQQVELHAHIWPYWRKIWADDDEIIDRMMMVEQHYENNLMHRAMRGQCHAGRAMMVLRSKYGYIEERHRLMADGYGQRG